MSMIFSSLIFFLLGLIIGSFLNVLVYRLRDAETLLGRSFCRNCKHQIRFYDNIPMVSFVLLRGQCRDCGEKISWQYPLLEAMTGGLFALVGYYFFSPINQATWIETVWLLGIVSCFVVIAAYDLKYMEIPLILLGVSAAITLAFLFFGFHVNEVFWSSQLGLSLFGGAVVGLFFFVLVFVSHETWMGWGDVWLGLVCGMIVGLPAALFMLTLSFASGAVVGIASLYLGGKNLKSQIPFAPFLVLGTLLAIFLPQVFPEYMRFFVL